MYIFYVVYIFYIRHFHSLILIYNLPFKDEAQTDLFKDPVRTAL